MGKEEKKGVETPLEMLRKIKREKQLTPININLQQSGEFDGSLNSLLNSTHKEKSENLEDIECHRYEEKVEK